MTTVLRIFSLLVWAASLHAQPYNFLSYSVGEGLAQSQVFALCEDARGYLWCGTQGGGLSRFDGREFETFSADKGLPSDYINAIFEDTQSQLWIGCSAGYAICKQSQYCAAFKTNYAVHAFCETKNGDVWLGTEQGLMRWERANGLLKKSAPAGLPRQLAVRSLLSAPKGVWVGSNRGAFCIDPSGSVILAPSLQNGLPTGNINAFAYDANGLLWIACGGGGLTVFDEAQNAVVAQYVRPLWPTSLRLDPSGKMWAGTSNEGLFVFDPSTSLESGQYIGEAQGLPHQHVRALLLDRNQQMWVATSGGGLARVLSQQFRHFTQANGLLGNRVYALHADDRDRIWLSASQNGIQMLDSTGFHAVGLDSGALAGVKCKAIVSDRKGNIWVGTDGRGLFRLDSTGAYDVPGVPSLRIQSLLLAPNGDIWLATPDNGVALLRDDPGMPGKVLVKKLGKSQGLVDLNINTLKLDGKGNVWFGAQSGLIGFFQDEKVAATFGGSQNGLPELPVRALTFDQSGQLWVGFRGGGVWGTSTLDLEVASPRPLFKALKAGLASQNIYLLLPDRLGHLWVGTEKGVDEVMFEAGSTNLKELRHYGRNEGFLGIETCQDAAIADRFGHLWFGTMNGLTKYVPTQYRASRATPILHFQQIELLYKPLAETPYANWLDETGNLKKGIQFDWDDNHLSFEFRAIDLASPEGMRYRWKLEGAPHAEWSPFSSKQSVNFAGLSAGDYTFWVQAIAADGTLSEPISATFSTQKPIWERWWFQCSGLLLLCAMVVWGVRKRIQRIRSAAQEKLEKLEVQNRLLQLEQKALQLQMNPHFIFNALNSIQSLVGTGNTAAARTELNAFAQLMRSVLSNSRQAWISLEEEINTLQQYLRIEQFCRSATPFEFNIVANGIDAESIALPPMLLQPFVENAVLHGIGHLQDRKGNIQISFDVLGETLRCTIADNGVGREKAALLRKERQPGHHSAALQITQERLRALAGHSIEQALVFEDLYDLSGKIAGTKVTVTLPLRMRW